MTCCYIIYSPSLDSFYIGVTHQSMNQSLDSHNTGKYSKSFTSKANDWEVFLTLAGEDYAHAIRIERKIKRMKSRKYLINLKKYPELLDKDRILVISKCDLLDDELKAEIRKELPDKIKSVLISSITGYGIDRLKDMIWEMLNP